MSFFKSSPPAPLPEAVTADASLAPNALIALRNIEKSYAHGTSRTYVLRRINVDIKEGEFVSIMGPSGAGKSTLLHIIGMHDSAWTGEYYFLDQPVHKLGAKDRARLHKQNFRRLVEKDGLVEGTGVVEPGTVGRPAELFRFRREVLRERRAPGVGLPQGRFVV